ncbi:MAG: phenylalanine--tRNA ligase subunit beta, partial [Candidatus Aerophobetes bacterium]|nr:phenylalanine--tRNA ligase subunit beta [Candidatus Aerophobetes bacterium]
MRVSYRWLKELVDFPFSPDELAEHLTNLGLEVKEVEPFGKLEKITVGRVVSIQNHPDADRLKVVKVDTGGNIFSLVCGAPNIKEGLLVPVALEGAIIHGGIKVKRAKIRGVESPGMICSENELGLGEDRSGIMVLPSHLSLGANLSEALGLDDFVLDFEITSDRADCLSVVGIAREISALTGNLLHLPSGRVERERPKKMLPEIQIMHPDGCPYYSACLIKGIKVGPSPLWLRQRIFLMGSKPVNNIVDVTNYVLWEMGQPLHPFDYSSIEGEKIIVRRAKNNEVLTTLDGVQRKLDESMLVIADTKRAIALAGIMGGENTQVQERTQDVLLESAYFDPISIRRTSMRLNLTTEASYRFERGVNPSGVKMALNRVSFLLQKIACVKLEGEIIERGKLSERKKWVFLRSSRVNRILGGRIPVSRMREILENLQFGIKEDKDGWRVAIPSFRTDVEREIDLVEEIARFYGYNRLRLSLPSLGDEEQREDRKEIGGKRAREILKGLGFYEVIGVSLVGEDFFKKANLPIKEGLKIRNPLSNQQRILRTHLFPSLLGIASYNLNQNIEECRIFELGNVYKR